METDPQSFLFCCCGEFTFCDRVSCAIQHSRKKEKRFSEFEEYAIVQQEAVDKGQLADKRRAGRPPERQRDAPDAAANGRVTDQSLTATAESRVSLSTGQRIADRTHHRIQQRQRALSENRRVLRLLRR